MKEVVVTDITSLRTKNLTLKTNNVAEAESVQKRETGSITGSRFVSNARRSCTYIRSNSISNFTLVEII